MAKPMSMRCDRTAHAKKVRRVRRMLKFVPRDMKPLFKHLLKLSIHSAKSGYCQRAGRELAKAMKIAVY